MASPTACASPTGLSAAGAGCRSPLSWGGFKRAGAEFDRTFERGPLSRIESGRRFNSRTTRASRKDDRTRVWGARRERAGPLSAWQALAAGSAFRSAISTDDVHTVGLEAAYDTRLDPVLPRNAVYVAAYGGTPVLRRRAGDDPDAARRARLSRRLSPERRSSCGAVREDATEPLPPYLKSLLGGWSSLRGFRAVVRRRHAGDRLARAAHAALVAPERRQARAQRLHGHRQGLRQRREVRRSAVSHRLSAGASAHPHPVSHGPDRRPRPRRRHAGEFRSGDHVREC